MLIFKQERSRLSVERGEENSGLESGGACTKALVWTQYRVPAGEEGALLRSLV